MSMHQIAFLALVLTTFAFGRRKQLPSGALHSVGTEGPSEHISAQDASASGLQSRTYGQRGEFHYLRPLAEFLLAIRAVPPASISSRLQEQHSISKHSLVSTSPEVASIANVDPEATSSTRKRNIVRGRVFHGFGKPSSSFRLIAFGIVMLVSLFFVVQKKILGRRSLCDSSSNGNTPEEKSTTVETANASIANVSTIVESRSHSLAGTVSLQPSRAAIVQMALGESEEDAQALGSSNDAKSANKPGFQLYSQRWVQLAYLSLFAFLSDWVCFAVAAEPGTFVTAYNCDPATLIDLFLFTNVFFCFLEPSIVGRFGLSRVIKTAGAVMSLGCLLRSGLPFSGVIQPYEAVVAGTVLVGAAQPFFQCTPPLLSAVWFGSNERALATATAINFNQIGIGTAFLVGGWLMTDVEGLSLYFSLMSVVSVVLAAAAFFQFQERPPTPPTASAASRLAAAADPNAPPPLSVGGTISLAQELLATPGFVQPLVAFVGSICVSNLVSAFIEDTLRHAGVMSQDTIDLAGAGFQAAIVVGGILLGGYVDRTKQYKQVTLACLLGGSLLLLPLGISGVPVPLVIAALLGLGALIGPVQPINAELAVEVAYPADENAIEALQQLSGNLGSALLVPIAERAGALNLRVGDVGPSERGDSLLLMLIAVFSLLYFSTFNSQLKRTAVDCNEGAADETLGCEVGCQDPIVSTDGDPIDVVAEATTTIDGDQSKD